MGSTTVPTTPLAIGTLGLVAFGLSAIAAPLVADEVDAMGRDTALQSEQLAPIALTIGLAVIAGALAVAALRRRFGRIGLIAGPLGALGAFAVLLPALVTVGNDDRGLAVFVVTLVALVPGFVLWILLVSEIRRDRTRSLLLQGGSVLVPISVLPSALGIFTDELIRTGGYQAMSIALALILPFALAIFALAVADRPDAPRPVLNGPAPWPPPG